MWFRRLRSLRLRIHGIHFGVTVWLVLLSCVTARCQAVSVELRTKTAGSQFHVGGVLLLDLLCAASTPDGYERNGGVALPEPYPLPDTSSVEPREVLVDPLGDY